MCTRYFAGGCPYDIAPLYGVAISEVHLSVWVIVYAINSCDQFAISYPESLEEQRKIARGFQNASTPGIPNCAGAIDGILIWTLKPSLKDANKSGIGQKKFLCGRKNKFGLNCQAVSDCAGTSLIFPSIVGVPVQIALHLKGVTYTIDSKMV
eukprot:CCRYP_020043-RA/>CCRYP_020043-RA protein AED:0.27 eAED:0.27 QI:0/-1/0/1/-1/1/1/0/151